MEKLVEDQKKNVLGPDPVTKSRKSPIIAAKHAKIKRLESELEKNSEKRDEILKELRKELVPKKKSSGRGLEPVEEKKYPEKSLVYVHGNIISKEEFEERIELIRNYSDEQIRDQMLFEIEENISLEEIKANRGSFIRTLVFCEHITYNPKDPVPLQDDIKHT